MACVIETSFRGVSALEITCIDDAAVIISESGHHLDWGNQLLNPKKRARVYLRPSSPQPV